MADKGRHNVDAVLVVALAAGLTKQQAAVEAGVSAKTVQRRWANPVFRQAIADAQADTVRQVAARLTAAGVMATTTLLRLLKAESESVQLGAARTLLEQAVKAREAADLESRIAALEERIEQQGGQRWSLRSG